MRGVHNTPLPQIRLVEDSIHLLHTHSHEEFSEIANQYEDESCLLCIDVSGVALLHPSLIRHYTYGGWQGTLEVHEYLNGIFNLLRLDPSISLIQPLEAAQFLVLRESPSRWTRARHFPEADTAEQLSIPTTCGPWHDGAGHFLTLYICKDYRHLLNLLLDLPHPFPGMQPNVRTALIESFRA